METFDNEKRNRYYGLRIGDIVDPVGPDGKIWNKGTAEVIAYGLWDNNAVFVKAEDGTETEWVAEWCHIKKKVEDRIPKKMIVFGCFYYESFDPESNILGFFESIKTVLEECFSLANAFDYISIFDTDQNKTVLTITKKKRIIEGAENHWIGPVYHHDYCYQIN